jgi:hypothetical protein
MVGLTVGIVDQSNHCGLIVNGIAVGCWHVDCSNCGCKINVSVAVGRRSWVVVTRGLVKTVEI